MPSARAVVACGAPSILARHPALLDELRHRDLRLLAVTEPAFAGGAGPGSRGTPDGSPLVLEDLALVEANDLLGFLAQVRQWSARYDVVAVTSIGEIFVEHAGLAADLLGLPSPGLRATRVCRDKQLQREFLRAWSPRSTLVRPQDRATAAARAEGFPLVLKPTGRFSSSGVLRVEDAGALAAAVGTYPEGEALLLEEYVGGREVSVESLVQGGRVLFASVTAKTTSEAGGPYFVETGHTVPAPDLAGEPLAVPGPARRRLLEANAAILDRLAFADGLSHAEFRIDARGDPVLMEVAARTPGDGIMALYHVATGAPLEVQALNVALGEPARYPAPRRFARQRYYDAPPGRLADVKLPGATVRWLEGSGTWPRLSPRQAGAAPWLHHVLVLAGRGARVGPSKDSFGRAVSVIVDAPDAAALDDIDRQVAAALEIVVEP